MKNHIFALLFLIVSVGLFGTQQDRTPGIQGNSIILLPNGWKIAPAGRHLPLDDLPLNMLESADGKYLIVTNNGYSKPVLSVIDLQRFYVLDRVQVDDAWFGLAWSPDGKRLYSSAGGAGAIQVFNFNKGKLKKLTTYKLKKPVKESFVGGICLSPDGKKLYAVQILGNTITALDAYSGKVHATTSLDAEPYTCITSQDGKSLYISLWGGSRVLEMDPANLRVRRTLKVGEHPGAMVLSPNADRLYVACANTNSVWVLNLKTGNAEEQISVALYPQAPMGSTPSALSISADGRKLLVTNSDNNTVAMVELSDNVPGKVAGFIPTGWYPTGASFSRESQRIYVLSGKGLHPVANPRGPEEPGYIGQLLLGTLSEIDSPNSNQLSVYTKRVYDLTPYSDAIRLTPYQAPESSPIPKRIGEPSPIKYVFYIIRENRTYDQIFGDIKEGNGDPSLCLFGEEITPNAHALTREFGLFDNFYVDAEVSADGHAFSTGAYANDFIEKTWPMNYAERGADYLTEGGNAQRNPYGNIAAPAQGYLWDAALRRNITVRSYGEFAQWNDPEKEEGQHTRGIKAGVPGLKDHINLEYPAWDLKISDNRRVDIWLKEFRKFETEGGLPRLTILHLPNDHTAGTYPGYPTPRAMVAENDLALGKMVEAITRSRFWKETAIFVLEDDAQDGPDHVDAHRSVALVISPYSRRKSVDSTMYTTSGMLRTIELILGIEPMSQYDAAATPMYNAFRTDPEFTPYIHVPARISLEETNARSAFGAAESMAMNLKEVDRIPMRLMNEILWKSVKGRESNMPPPVRAAFVVSSEEEEE